MRPLGFGEIFDVAIKIFWRNAGTLIGIVAVVIVPVQVVSSLIIVSTFPEPELLGGSTFRPPTPTEPTQIITGEDIALMIAGIIVVWVIAFIATALATGASYKAVGDAYLGTKPDWKTSLRYGLRRMHSVAWVTLLSTILLALIFGAVVLLVAAPAAAGSTEAAVIFGILGFLGAAVLATWLWAAWSVAIPALLTEDVRGSKALRRSFRLVRGTWWRTFGLLLLGYIGAGIVSGIISTIPQLVLLTDVGDSVAASLAINGLGSALANILTTPFLAALLTVIYFDLRVRKEGFDLQLLAYRIGVPPPTELPENLRPPRPVGWQGPGYPPPGYAPPGYPPPPPSGYPYQPQPWEQPPTWQPSPPQEPPPSQQSSPPAPPSREGGGDDQRS